MLCFMDKRLVSASPIVLDDPKDSILDTVDVNRFTLVLGCAAGTVFGFVGLVLTGIVRLKGAPTPLIGWAALTLSAFVIAVTVRQLLWPVPVVEVTRRGVRVRIGSPVRRSGLFFVPWARVRAVVFTQTVANRGGREDALGFEIEQDDRFRLPEVRWNSSHAAPDARKCDVVFAASMISGDVRECVRKIEKQRLRVT